MRPYNFAGLSKEFANPETARIVILPVAYDATVTFKSGAREGPRAIIAASQELEYYDEETDYEVYRLGIATLPELTPVTSSPRDMLNKVKSTALFWLSQGKFIVMLGGEHLLTLGMVEAHAAQDSEFSVLHLDAHADLRLEYEGTPYSNACVMRLVWEHVPVVSAGIRALSREEAEFIRERNLPVFSAMEVKKNLVNVIENILANLKDKVYLTIDLDCFDSGQMPAVGTPEPGGLDWYEVLAIVKAVAEKKRIIGFDVMELCPQAGLVAPDFLAARLVYKLLSYIFAP
ncbi:MAG: agmatinase [Candidatus Desulfofervidaceae bacterium]|nr:agmatinase [Candidatus Desulfofervidaceae bacterium]MDL1969889.1 agmatinase [Candidatus Desulfofervidaceae bacterium]